MVFLKLKGKKHSSIPSPDERKCLVQENDALLEQNLKLEQELKEVKLDLRIEKREVEKKASLLTFIRERETKNKDKITELEAKVADLETSLDSLK